MERQLGGICRVTPFSPPYPLWLGRTHSYLELSSLQNRRPTIPMVTAPSLAGVNSQDACCHVEGVLCPQLGMTEMSPEVHCDWRLGPEGRSLEHSCGP